MSIRERVKRRYLREHWMNNMAVVQRVMDRILVRDLESAMTLIAPDAELTLLPTEPSAAAETMRGGDAVLEYFGSLGAIVTFWEVNLVPEGDRVLVLGRESYSLNGGLESEAEFMLVFQLREALVSRIVVVENLASEAPLLPTVLCDAADLEPPGGYS
jgi:ketosteroid isomerase-like protein